MVTYKPNSITAISTTGTRILPGLFDHLKLKKEMTNHFTILPVCDSLHNFSSFSFVSSLFSLSWHHYKSGIYLYFCVDSLQPIRVLSLTDSLNKPKKI